jgi:polygalacturonase
VKLQLPKHTLKCAVHLLSLILIGPIGAQETTTPEQRGWDLLPDILAEIKDPTFRDQDFHVTEYGAKGDGKTDCKGAFDEAIAACVAAGGGRVVVPEGKWLTKGPIHLKSNVNFHVSENATVLFSTDPSDYLPLVFTRFEGTELMNFSPLIYAFEQENVAVTGKGTLDGQAAEGKWWNWKGHWGGETEIGWKKGDPDQLVDVAALNKQADENMPATERIYGDGHRLRPSFVQFYKCKNVMVEGITINNSPMWIIHPVLSENVIVRDATVDSHGPNNDGCNPESSRNVLIEKCRFNTGDDCIAIKSGRNAEGRRINTPSENIIVRDCEMADGHGGVVLGSEMSGGIRNVFVENCRMDSPQLDRAIRLKSNPLRGGYLENLYVRNIEVGEVKEAVLHIDLEYAREKGDFPPTVHNLYLENVTSQKSDMPIYLVGIEGHNIENVQIRNCEFANAKRASVIEHVGRIILENVSQPRVKK